MGTAYIVLSWPSFSKCFKLIDDFSKKTCFWNINNLIMLSFLSPKGSPLEVEAYAWEIFDYFESRNLLLNKFLYNNNLEASIVLLCGKC